MIDNISQEIRSYNMSRVRNNGTKPEEKARKYLFSHGFRYRNNVRNLQGCPDIVLPKYRMAYSSTVAFGICIIASVSSG